MKDRFTTINLIAAHVKKHPVTVLRGLKAKGVTLTREPSEKGFRINESDANRFIARQFPGCGPLPVSPVR